MTARKKRSGQQANITRMEVLRQIKQGKKIREIAKEFGARYGDVYKVLANIRKKARPENRKRISEIIKINRGTMFSPEKAAALESFAKKILTRETQLVSENPWKTAFPLMYEKRPNTLKKIIRLLRSTDKLFIQIKKETGSSWYSIHKAYKLLRAQGEEIHERGMNARPSQRKRSRVTGFFDKKQIKEILESHEHKILDTANKFYRVYSPYFNFTNVTAEGIADYIRDSLEWKLKTFDLGQRKGKDLKYETQKYCAQQIKFLALDKLKSAKNHYQKISSLAKDVAEKKKQRTARPEEMMALIESLSKKAGLDQREKAVLYGKAVGMTQGEMSEIAGVRSSFIGYIVTSGRVKLRAAGFRPIRRQTR